MTIETVEKPSEDLVHVDGITVDLLQDAVRLHLGKGFEKLVSYEDFIDTISKLMDKNKEIDKLSKLWLPPGVFYLAMSSRKMEIACYYPECQRDLTYHARNATKAITRKSVIPNILISHVLTKDKGDTWGVSDTRYFCTDKPLQELARKCYFSLNDGLSLMPFTNTYTNGRLCYGQNVRTSQVTVPDMRGLHWYYEMLFTTPFNDDLGINAISYANITVPTWYQLLANLAIENKPFPYDKLNTASR